MRAIGFATVFVAVTISAAPANAARFVVEYSCRSDSTLVQLAAARDHAQPRVFQARVRHAVFAGRCKIVRYHGPRATKSARRSAKPRKTATHTAVARKTVTTFVPAGKVHPVRVSYAEPVRRYGVPERFPGPPLFVPGEVGRSALLGHLTSNDSALGSEARDLRLVEPEFREHVSGVLTRQRRPRAHATRRLGHFIGRIRDLHRAIRDARQLDLGEHSARPRMGVIEHLVDAAHRAERDLAAEHLGDLGLGAQPPSTRVTNPSTSLRRSSRSRVSV